MTTRKRFYRCFSALQRAENSSTVRTSANKSELRGFSALQRAENSSTKREYDRLSDTVVVSVLFSEPKIPQPTVRPSGASRRMRFSALQRAENSSTFWSISHASTDLSFSALQRAENSSTGHGRDHYE